MQKTKQRYPAYKATNIYWIGDIPVDWEVIKYNFLYKSAMWQTILKEDLFDDWWIPVYSATEEDKFFWYVNDAKVILNDWDLVIPARWNSIWHVKLVKNKSTTTQTTIYSKLLNRNLINSRFTAYLFWWLKNVFFFFDNTAIPQITVEQVKDNFLILPPLTEQQAIADYLDSKTSQIDQIISLKQQQIELLKERRTALINHVVTKGLDPNVEMVESGIEWIGMIPKGWEVRKLKYCLNTVVDNRWRTPETLDQWIPLLEVNAITEEKYPNPWSITKFLSEESYKDYVRKDIKEWDILFVTVWATIWKSCIIPNNFNYCILQNIVWFRFNPKVLDSRLFLYHTYTDWFKEFYKLRNKANTLDSIKVSIFINEQLPIPTLEEQQSIADYLDSKTSQIDQTITAVEKSIELLTEYKQSLISHVVTGKVKVF